MNTTELDTTGNPNVIVLNRDEADAARKLARGAYQQGIISGYNCLSGADLRGKAKLYSGKYAASRGALLTRMREAGVRFREVVGSHNKRILVLG